MDETGEPRKRSQDTVDQSNLLRKRAKRAIDRSEELVARAHHNWHLIAVGRICTICRTAQVQGEFDDAIPCKPPKAS